MPKPGDVIRIYSSHYSVPPSDFADVKEVLDDGLKVRMSGESKITYITFQANHIEVVGRAG